MADGPSGSGTSADATAPDLEALRDGLLGEEAYDYEPPSSSTAQPTLNQYTETLIDMLKPEHTAPVPKPLTYADIRDSVLSSPQRHALASLSELSAEIEARRKEVQSRPSVKELVRLREAMPPIRTKLDNLKKYVRGKQVKPKLTLAEKAYSQLAKELALFTPDSDSEDDDEMQPPDSVVVADTYNTGKARSVDG